MVFYKWFIMKKIGIWGRSMLRNRRTRFMCGRHQLWFDSLSLVLTVPATCSNNSDFTCGFLDKSWPTRPHVLDTLDAHTGIPAVSEVILWLVARGLLCKSPRVLGQEASYSNQNIAVLPLKCDNGSVIMLLFSGMCYL